MIGTLMFIFFCGKVKERGSLFEIYGCELYYRNLWLIVIFYKKERNSGLWKWDQRERLKDLIKWLTITFTLYDSVSLINAILNWKQSDYIHCAQYKTAWPRQGFLQIVKK